MQLIICLMFDFIYPSSLLLHCLSSNLQSSGVVLFSLKRSTMTEMLSVEPMQYAASDHTTHNESTA